MSTLQYLVRTQPGGNVIADYSNRVQGLTFASNNRGYADTSCFVPMSLAEAFQLYDRPGLPHVTITDNAANRVYEGRLEIVSIVDGGVNLQTFGYSRAMEDTPVTEFWSTTDVTKFRPTRSDEVSSRTPEAYKFDTNNRLQISLPQGQIYGNATDVGSLCYELPANTLTGLIGVMFDAVVTLPTNWLFGFVIFGPGFTGATVTNVVTGNNGVQPVNKFFTFSPGQIIEFFVYNNTGANYTVANAPNVWKATITNLRMVTSINNQINTTTTANFTAGAGVTISVGSTAGMYVGQRLHIGIPAAAGIGCNITSITDATHFVTSIDPSFGTVASGANVQAFLIYADDIVKSLVGTVSALNPGQLQSSTHLIQSPQVDLLNEVYEDRYPADILDYLIKLGDNQTVPRQWEWGVRQLQFLYFQPQGYNAQTWYIDISSINIERTMDNLFNGVYAVYHRADGFNQRTATQVDAGSVSRFAVNRVKPQKVETTSSVQALIQANAALNDSSDPKPRSSVVITELFDQFGARWPVWAADSGDTIIIRNLPPILGTSIDRIRVFRLTRATVDADKVTNSLEPENPIPTLDALLALAVPPSWVNRSWWQILTAT